MVTQKEENNNVKGFISSVIIHALILAGCYFFYINVQIPKEEIETGGIVINYGTSDEGMGDNYTSTEEPAIDETINNTPVIDPNRPNSPVEESTTAEKDVVTQDMEDAPEVADKNTNNNINNTTTPVNTEKPVDNTPKVEQRALFKGKKNNDTGTGDGTGNKPGNQGKPDGSTQSNNYTGDGGSGGGGVALNLSGRKFITKPRIQDDGQTQGKIAVDITVDKTGTIITAKAGGRGTTISNAALWEKCEKAALGCKLNEIASGPEIQAGSIVFTFILE
jgi:hypothetical protein